MLTLTINPSSDVQLQQAQAALDAAERELAWEMTKAAADVAGIVDPTPVSDAVSMGMSLIDGDLIGAGLSLISMVPYLGDALGKTVKGARAAKKIQKLRKTIEGLLAKIRALQARTRSGKAASDTIKNAQKRSPNGGICQDCIRAQKRATLKANAAAGKAAEIRAKRELEGEGNRILASQVTIQTSAGPRRVDHLIRTPSGKIVAVEVKSGGGKRTAQQLLKDKVLAREGGKIVGANGKSLRGTYIPKLETVERIYP